MQLSDFGRKFTTSAGTPELMDDMGRALASGDHVAMFGGGNPAHIPEMHSLYERRMRQLLADPQEFRELIGNYDPPQGNLGFIQAVVKLLNGTYGWGITDANVIVTPGSQTGFFNLFNMLAGPGPAGNRRILLPLVPEYIGYADQGVHPGMFESRRPRIELHGEHRFKYFVDFKTLNVGSEHAAICISRPTNPTGNVLTNDEVSHLSELASSQGIPLIIDNAYGLPFPGIIYTEAAPMWNENIVYAMSLSKVGLPSSRVGIFIARPEIIDAMTKTSAIMSLASPTFGQAMARGLIDDGSLVTASANHIRPFYQRAAEYAQSVLAASLEGVPYRLHEHEGAFFFWLWFEGLPVSSRELYARLKDRGVLTIPGEYFFPGLGDSRWRHQRECLRLNFARPKREVDEGFAILGEELRAVYAVKARKRPATVQ